MDQVKIQKRGASAKHTWKKTQPECRTEATLASYVGRQHYLRPTHWKAQTSKNLLKSLIRSQANLGTVAKKAKHTHASMD